MKNKAFTALCGLFALLLNTSFAEEDAPAAASADYAYEGAAEQVSSFAAIASTIMPLILIAVIVFIIVKASRSKRSNDEIEQIDDQSAPEELKKLAQLKQEGVLSESEFEEAKKKILKL